ncbi:opsin, ultraviolet-sensitive-like [Rhopalosiphum maidis]|uniref:opsin, ultraviolet-sensitive-like n=1 Tax=Rhopalosiphum maidis TaxID=43146 RepID=UPI000EFF0199|nr:opsin, ultraviolet-sensitive-like [Rhopalosiphum maidis]XP_026823156.1 opsin, ultraviolet-sensitive-like [Rhopalosiphum maidis]XP_026823157.1 opsin, ultraviolet-sensitive-like [Rhopalosiphum maidis]XP_026823158.1 opsin, ultraviolet-sensitive-like [Rhopalosiphum maidis]
MTDFKTKYPVNLWKDHGIYTDDYIKLINSHWLKFMPPHPTSHYVLGVLYTVIMMFGCTGNSLVIFMYFKCKSLQTPANMLIINLAISDFIMLAKASIFIYNSYYLGPALGKLGCQICGFLGGLTGTVSIMTLAAISLDRYYVIVRPLKATVKTTKQRARIWIGIIWICGFSFSIVPVLDLGYSRYVSEGYLTSCSFDYLSNDDRDKHFILVFFIAAWCIPFTLILYCYVRILMAVWMTTEIVTSRVGQQEEKRKTDIRLGYMVIGALMLWFVSWTPYAVVALLGVFDLKEYISPLGSMIPALFCKAASCTDPWFYAITHPRFKKELMKLLTKSNTRKLVRNYCIKKGRVGSHLNENGNITFENRFKTEYKEVKKTIFVLESYDNNVHCRESTFGQKTESINESVTKFPGSTNQESFKYMLSS